MIDRLGNAEFIGFGSKGARFDLILRSESKRLVTYEGKSINTDWNFVHRAENLTSHFQISLTFFIGKLLKVFDRKSLENRKRLLINSQSHLKLDFAKCFEKDHQQINYKPLKMRTSSQTKNLGGRGS